MLLATICVLLLAGIGAVGAFLLSELGNINRFFTKVKEGTAKCIKRGGQEDHWYGSYKGHHLNDPRSKWFDPTQPAWEVIDHRVDNHTNNKKLDRKYDRRGWLLRTLGLYWVGWPWQSSVHTYELTWSEMKQDDKGNLVVWARKAMTNFIYLAKFPYAFPINNARDSDNVQIAAIAQATLRTTNPSRSLFAAENYLELIASGIIRRGRDYLGARSYKKLRSETDDGRPSTGTPRADTDQDSFGEPIRALTFCLLDEDPSTPGPKGFDGHLGQAVEAADLLDLHVVGPHAEEIDAAATAEFVAEHQGEAKKIAAAAEAIATTTKSVGEANAIRNVGSAEAYSLLARMRVLQTNGAMGLLLAQLDAMKTDNPGKTIIWANNPFVAGIPGLSDMFKAAGSEQSTPADAKVAMEALLAELQQTTGTPPVTPNPQQP